MSKKKKKKSRKEPQQQIQFLSGEQLIQQGKQAIEDGKARDAISFLKSAIKKECNTDEVHPLLFRAYLIREEQLRKKNLILEADTVKKQAMEYMPKFEQLSEDDLLAYLSACAIPEAFGAYEKYLAANQKKSSKTEQLLAYRLFQNNCCWELTERLDESNLLRRDAISMQKAVAFMNNGKWEDALDILQPVSRTSPFAPIRLFCRAMVSFYAEDDKDAFKSLSMIPDDFPLENVVRHLKHIVCNPVHPPQKKESMQRLAPLWEGPVNIEKDIAELFHNLEERRFRQAKSFICDFADRVYPRNPTAARVFILQVLWTMTLQQKIDDDELENICAELLPSDQAELLLIKTELLRFDSPFTSVGKYIYVLEKEFPDPETRQIAQGFIIQDTVDKMNEFKGRLNIMQDKKGIQTYGKLLGIRSKSLEMILIEMAAESIRLDLHHREGYELIARLPRASRPAKKIAETALTEMASRFPDDPFPCLELATLYYETHAFRKAENILAEAMKRAPHDNRVIDRHGIGLLIAVEKNLKRGKFHLAEKDLERVSQLENKKRLPFIAEKRVLFHLIKMEKDKISSAHVEQDLKDILEKEVKPLSLPERIRTLSILMPDVKSKTIADKKTVLNVLEKILDKELKQLKTLSSPEIAKLLMPLEKEYEAILPSLKIAPIFLKKWKNILNKIDNSEIMPLYDMILEPEFFSLIRKDIKQRMKKAKNKDLLLLEFYLITLEHLSGKEHNPDLFENIIEEANGNVKEELRAASRRLSKHASGALKKALELFDFEILDDMMPFFYGDDGDEDFPFPGDDDMEGGFDKILDMLELLDPNSEDLEKELLDEVITDFEAFIDEIGVRGSPEVMIRGLREMLRQDSKTRREFDMLAKLVDKSKSGGRLSREAHLILFGKKKK